MLNLLPFLVLCALGTISGINSTEGVEPAEIVDKATTQACFDGTGAIKEEVLSEIFKISDEMLKKKQDLECTLAKKGRVINLKKKQTDTSLIRDFKSDPHIRRLESASLIFEEASCQLYKKFNLSGALINIDLKGDYTKIKDACIKQLPIAKCDANSKYREINGECNNLQNIRWGSALTCHARLLAPNYVGSSGFRKSVDGKPLPRPRRLSLNVHYHANIPSIRWTHMFTFFGQLVDHDITHTPQSTTIDNQAIYCCPPEKKTHPQCAPIIISKTDPFYSQFNITCLNFVRSVVCPTCSFGPRQQMNQLTSFIDCSFVYGSSEKQSNHLRANDGTGRLRTQNSNYGDLLPRSTNPEDDQCSYTEKHDMCFEAGDSRVNEHTLLASMQTVFMREHNRLATKLKQINPHWSGDKLFQEARRILGAVMQVIVYTEFLPILLGRDGMSHFKLSPGSWTMYDPKEDPTTLTEFSTAAYRMGHTMINSVLTYTPLNDNKELRFLRNEFFQPFDLYKGYTGPLVAGASNSPGQKYDRHIVPDVRNFLYRLRGDQAGLDLAAFNINRGRDHGLPTYIAVVRFCSNGKIDIKDFQDLLTCGLMQKEQVYVLQRNYRFVDDIDLWTGIVSEIPVPGAVVGPTAACIIGRQFYKLKYGDRFYFEHKDEAGSFTCEQLEELRKTKLSHIFCMNTEIPSFSTNVMLYRSVNNSRIECRYVKGVNLSYWEDV